MPSLITYIVENKYVCIWLRDVGPREECSEYGVVWRVMAPGLIGWYGYSRLFVWCPQRESSSSMGRRGLNEGVPVREAFVYGVNLMFVQNFDRFDGGLVNNEIVLCILYCSRTRSAERTTLCTVFVVVFAGCLFMGGVYWLVRRRSV